MIVFCQAISAVLDVPHHMQRDGVHCGDIVNRIPLVHFRGATHVRPLRDHRLPGACVREVKLAVENHMGFDIQNGVDRILRQLPVAVVVGDTFSVPSSFCLIQIMSSPLSLIFQS